jgi:hypothetical protein
MLKLRRLKCHKQGRLNSLGFPVSICCRCFCRLFGLVSRLILALNNGANDVFAVPMLESNHGIDHGRGIDNEGSRRIHLILFGLNCLSDKGDYRRTMVHSQACKRKESVKTNASLQSYSSPQDHSENVQRYSRLEK